MCSAAREDSALVHCSGEEVLQYTVVERKCSDTHVVERTVHMMTSHGLIIDSPSNARSLRRLIAHLTLVNVEIPMYLIAHLMLDQKCTTSDVFDSPSDASGKPTFYFIVLFHAFLCLWCFL